MRKQQFIEELTKALAQVDPQTKGEIISDIHEHFSEGAAQGLSEEEICINLGQPSQIVEQVMEELRASKEYNSHNDTQWRKSNISESIGDLMGNIGELVSDVVGSIGIGIMRNHGNVNFDDDMVFSTDFSTGETTRASGRGGYEINIEESFTDVTSLAVSLSICNLNIATDPQSSSARVIIRGQSRYNNFEIENKNGCLTVIERQPTFKFEIFNFKTKLNAIIYLPAGFNGPIKSRTNCGSITIGNTSGDVDAKATAGAIKLQNHKAHTVRLRASAGGIGLKDCAIANINAKSSAGAISIMGKETSHLELDSSAGAVSVQVSKLGGKTDISSNAGAIYLEAREVMGNITAKASAGGIHVRLPKDANCRIEAKKPSVGNVENHLNGNPQSPYTLQVSTSVGSIKLEALN